MPGQAKTCGLHHVGLTVPNLNNARTFFIDVLGFELLGEMEDYPAFYASDGVMVISIWQVKDPTQTVSFDRHTNLGLHHIALAVPNNEALDALHKTFTDSNLIKVEFSPESMSGGLKNHMMCLFDSEIRIEFTAHAP